MVKVDNKSDILVLITAGYPFDNHENYLETEIIYLSERFSKVIIRNWYIFTDSIVYTITKIKIIHQTLLRPVQIVLLPILTLFSLVFPSSINMLVII